MSTLSDVEFNCLEFRDLQVRLATQDNRDSLAPKAILAHQAQWVRLAHLDR